MAIQDRPRASVAAGSLDAETTAVRLQAVDEWARRAVAVPDQPPDAAEEQLVRPAARFAAPRARTVARQPAAAAEREAAAKVTAGADPKGFGPAVAQTMESVWPEAESAAADPMAVPAEGPADAQ